MSKSCCLLFNSCLYVVYCQIVVYCLLVICCLLTYDIYSCLFVHSMFSWCYMLLFIIVQLILDSKLAAQIVEIVVKSFRITLLQIFLLILLLISQLIDTSDFIMFYYTQRSKSTFFYHQRFFIYIITFELLHRKMPIHVYLYSPSFILILLIPDFPFPVCLPSVRWTTWYFWIFWMPTLFSNLSTFKR